MRKNNMFGIVIKEEWKLDRKKFLIMLGIVFVVNLALIALLGYAILKWVFNVNVTVDGSWVSEASQIPNLEFIPIILALQIFLIMLLPLIFADKLIKELFKSDSSFLYKMLPISGFELFGGKLIVDFIEFVLASIVVFLTSLVSGTQIIMLSAKSFGDEPQGFFQILKDFVTAILNNLGWEGFRLFLTFALFICALCGLIVLVSVLRHSFSINLNSKLVGAIGYMLCFAVMFAIGHIDSSVVTLTVLAVLTVGTFIVNCVLYDRRVSV